MPTPWPFPWPEDRIARYTAHRVSAPPVIDGRLGPQEALTKIQADGQKVIDDYWAKAG